MKLKNIKVDTEIWWKLNQLKLDWKLKTLSNVITKLVIDSNIDIQKNDEVSSEGIKNGKQH